MAKNHDQNKYWPSILKKYPSKITDIHYKSNHLSSDVLDGRFPSFVPGGIGHSFLYVSMPAV